MPLAVVGMADCGWSADPSAVLITYALGSCIGVTVYDPVARVGGMLHYMLPESSIDTAKAAKNPFMFADTGLPLLFRRTLEMGAQKHRLVVRIAGGSQVLDPNGVFSIGKRNYAALRKILWKAGVLVQSEDVGGSGSRTLRMELVSGRCSIRTGTGEEKELGSACGARPKGGEPCLSRC
ncbi:MAG TPA: chemotaxis protein CheD [Solibacterales bacterium]|nr:chemotaxis protein CheD [Bryobacterales bacterium]